MRAESTQSHSSDRGDELDVLLTKLGSNGLDAADKERLESLVARDPVAMKRYLETVEVDALLRWRSADAHPGTSGASNPPAPARRRSFRPWVLGSAAAAAACLAIGVWVADPGGRSDGPVVAQIRGGGDEGIAQQSAPAAMAMPGAETLRAGAWTLRADPGSDLAIAEDGTSATLNRGAVYAALGPAPGHVPLTITTPAGTVTAETGRFHLETNESSSEPDMTTTTTQATGPLTRLFVLAGLAVLANEGVNAQTNPGEIAEAVAHEAPRTLEAEGQYAEALAIYRKLLADPSHGGAEGADDLRSARDCLAQLGRMAEIDALAESAAEVHGDDWRMLRQAAQLYWEAPHYGSMIEGAFVRADPEQRGRQVDVTERDRVRALQLMERAMPLVGQDDDGEARAAFFNALGGMVTGDRQVWNWQYLTNLETLPEYGDPTYWSTNSAAPVDMNGDPVFFDVPESWEAAANDGERWRWTLEARKNADPSHALDVDLAYADFLLGQFGVHTAGGFEPPILEDGEIQPEGRHTAHTLTDNETIARLATGVKRFEMPEAHNFIRIYQAIADTPAENAPVPLRGVRFREFHGDWDALPDFGQLEPARVGEAASGLFDLEVTERREHFGLVFEASFEAPESGEYRFQIWSDDGSRLKVGDGFTIDNDGLHGAAQNNEGTVKLEAGAHPIRVEFFEKTGDEALVVQVWGPGLDGVMLSRMRHEPLPQERALERLAELHENRRQLGKAADYWRTSIERFGAGLNFGKRARLDQIVLPWARMEPAPHFAEGRPIEIPVTFRNATSVAFEARGVDIESWLADVKAHLESDPAELDDRANFGALGGRLLRGEADRYFTDRRVEWSAAVTPAPDHWDRRIHVAAPLPEPGAWWVRAQAEGGNATWQLVWITDTAIVFKHGDNEHLYQVVDSATGNPLAGVNLEIFGARSRMDREKGRTVTDTVNFAKRTDADGIAAYDADLLPRDYRRLVIARTEDGRFGILGDFLHDGFAPLRRTPYQAAKAWVATDRPVYRPGQQVYGKAWVRQADYTMGDVSVFGGREFVLRLQSPDGRQLSEQELTADAFGGIAFDHRLEAHAMLGVYGWQVILRNYTPPGSDREFPEYVLGQGSFRVEEYKKPEFEVTIDGPDEPAALGETIEAVIRASYFFGAPVTNAQVKFTVKRTDDQVAWFPPRPWDWFYGERYWWWGYDYAWYPGFGRWCIPPPGWFQPGPDEVILENTVPIGADGTVKVTIDTAAAKERWPDRDHRYTITAEVVDASRRTITSTGSVLAAREPFRVFTWVDRGHFRQGDQIGARFHARTPDGKGVAGKGSATLYRVTYAADGTPNETIVQTWESATDSEGYGSLSLAADAPGQYRLAVVIADTAGREQEGAALVRVLGPDGAPGPEGDGAFRFAELEIVPDKAEYRPGDKVRLLINADGGGTVALFVRPADGQVPRPEIIRLDGKSAVREIEVMKADMPNFHVEAFTVRDGRLYTASRSIAVPPEERMLTLEVEPSGERFEPGGKAKVVLRVTDSDGNPFVGSTVVTVYDKALESIAASNTPEIRAWFWQWIRGHYINQRTNLGAESQPLVRQGDPAMGDIGRQWWWGAGFGGGGRAFGMNRRGEGADLFFFSGRDSLRFAGAETFKAFAMDDFSPSAQAGSGALYGASYDIDGLALAQAKTGAIYNGFQFVDAAAGGAGRPGLPEIAVRSRFADTAFWAAAIETDADGTAEIEIDLPENLTTWKIHAWGMGHGTRVGHGEAEIITSKDVLVRLQGPRFFTERDEAVLSANVHNYTGEARDIEVTLTLEGDALELLEGTPLSATVQVEPDGDERVDWRVRAAAPGEALVRVTAVAGGPGDKGDAMEQRFPVIVRGALRTESWSLALRGNEESGTIEMTVPEERRPAQSHLEIRFSPSVALALVDALPYLVGYPYDNSESATSRLGALTSVQRILAATGVDLQAVRDKLANLNPQEIGDPNERAAQWKRHDETNPVYDNAAARALVDRCLRDIAGMQNADGGWGWFNGDTSSAHSTAYVVHHLIQAKLGESPLVPGVVERGIAWLQGCLERETQKLSNAERKIDPWKAKADESDAFVLMVVAEHGSSHDAMLEFLYRDRLDLSPYAQAMLGLACDSIGDAGVEKRDMIVRNLAQFRVDDQENQTAWLRLPDRGNWWWRWFGDETEANAWYLKLLARVEPKGTAAASVAKYLLNNRKHATHWHSTRCTATAVEALGEFVVASGEADPDLEIEVLIDGESKRAIRITKENLFAFDNVIELNGDAVTGGDHVVEFRRKGRGPLYANVYLTNFSTEDVIAKAGLEIGVERRYYRVTEEPIDIAAAGSRGQVLDFRTTRTVRTPIASGDELAAGDIVEVELIIDSKNDYEYLQFSDSKAAGFEALEVQSGYRWLGGTGAYMELRDRQVDFFIRSLPRGIQTLNYRLRAEVPGTFTALPARGDGVYAPELRANSDSFQAGIVEAP